jgi:hypothetical protein
MPWGPAQVFISRPCDQSQDKASLHGSGALLSSVVHYFVPGGLLGRRIPRHNARIAGSNFAYPSGFGVVNVLPSSWASKFRMHVEASSIRKSPRVVHSKLAQ